MDAGKILSRLVYHIQTGYLKYSEIDEIFNQVPDHCKYSGKAYRVLYCTQDQIDKDCFKNLYWSKSLSGIEDFLNKEKKPNYILVESDIVWGIDLNELFSYLNSQLPQDKTKVKNHYQNEEEILVLDYKNFKIR